MQYPKLWVPGTGRILTEYYGCVVFQLANTCLCCTLSTRVVQCKTKRTDSKHQGKWNSFDTDEVAFARHFWDDVTSTRNQTAVPAHGGGKR